MPVARVFKTGLRRPFELDFFLQLLTAQTYEEDLSRPALDCDHRRSLVDV